MVSLKSIQIGFLVKLANEESLGGLELFLSNLEKLIKNNKEKEMNEFSLVMNTKFHLIHF